MHIGSRAKRIENLDSQEMCFKMEFFVNPPFLLLLLGVGASRLFRGTSQDYMLASHSIGPFLLLMSIFGTTMTAFALVGSTGESFKEGVGVYGMLASSSGIIHSLCFLLLGVKVWELGKKYEYRTQVQFFVIDSRAVGLVPSCFLCLSDW